MLAARLRVWSDVTERNRTMRSRIERALRQLEQGAPVAVVCRRLGIARSTLSRWRARLAAEAGLQQRLEEENRRLRRRVRDLAADKIMLQDILRRRDI
jgi:putative transposase